MRADDPAASLFVRGCALCRDRVVIRNAVFSHLQVPALYLDKNFRKHVSRVCVLQVQFLTEILPLLHPLGSLVLLFSSISGRVLPFCDLDLFRSFFALVSLPS